MSVINKGRINIKGNIQATTTFKEGTMPTMVHTTKVGDKMQGHPIVNNSTTISNNIRLNKITLRSWKKH